MLQKLRRFTALQNNAAKEQQIDDCGSRSILDVVKLTTDSWYFVTM